MTKRAVLYARVSNNDRSRTNGSNLQSQVEMCREYAHKHNYEIVAELAEDDQGASGATFDLPQLTKALEMAHSKKFDVLIVRELDRLSRDLAKQLIVEQELKMVGVAIEYVMYDFPDTPEGRLNKNLRAMLAEYEREKIKQRMMRGRYRRVREGRIILNTSAPPYGYRINTDRTNIEPDEEQSEIVRLIFQWYVSGDDTGKKLGLQKIAEKLTELQVPTWIDLHPDALHGLVKRKPNEWNYSSVRRMIKNTVYVGRWTYGKEQVTLDTPPIIDEDVFEQAQKQRQENRVKAKRNIKHLYLLRHRLTCGLCKHVIQCRTKTQKNGTYSKGYVCGLRTQHIRYAEEKCWLPWLNGPLVDGLLWDWIKSKFVNLEELRVGLEEYQSQHAQIIEPLRLKQQIARDMITKIQDRIDREKDLYRAGLSTLEDVKERTSALEQEMWALQRQDEKLTTQLSDQKVYFNIDSIMEFAKVINGKLATADDDLEVQCQIVEQLHIQGIVMVEDGQVRVHITGALGDTVLSFDGSESENVLPGFRPSTGGPTQALRGSARFWRGPSRAHRRVARTRRAPNRPSHRTAPAAASPS